MIVLRLSDRNGKPSVVRRQIFFCQILVGGFVAIDLLPPQFLDQPILMGPVVAFYPALRLGCTGGNDPDAQFLTLRPNCVTGTSPRNCSAGVAFACHVLPIGVERTGHAIFLNPGPQHPGGRPDRLFLP